MCKVSVIIPLYNKAPHISRTLTSVLNQKAQDFEVIVVDDGSTDNGADIVKSFNDPRIRLIRQDNQGVSAARSRGVMESKTDFIAFLDADDEWMPLHLETILRLREKYPKAGLYTTAYANQAYDGRIRRPGYKFIPSPPWEGLLPNYFKSAALGDSPTCSSVVGIPKNVYFEAGGFSKDHWFYEDLDFFGRIALKYPVAFSWELGAVYHLDATNRASNKERPLDYENPFFEFAKNAIRSGNVPEEFIEPINEYLYITKIHQVYRYAMAGDTRTARAILKQCKTRWHYPAKLEWLILTALPYQLLMFLQRQKTRLFKMVRS